MTTVGFLKYFSGWFFQSAVELKNDFHICSRSCKILSALCRGSVLKFVDFFNRCWSSVAFIHTPSEKKACRTIKLASLNRFFDWWHTFNRVGWGFNQIRSVRITRLSWFNSYPKEKGVLLRYNINCLFSYIRTQVSNFKKQLKPNCNGWNNLWNNGFPMNQRNQTFY